MGNVYLQNDSDSESVHLKIREVKGIDPVDLHVKEVRNIDPVAHHVKEINHIDPINIDSFHVNQVRNIDPIKVDKFQVTNLPPMNVALRQLPPLDMNVRRMPPISVGTYQDFHVPSNYTVSGKFLGLELFRILLKGSTHMIPRDKYRKEQEIRHNRSYAIEATGGNPAIPSKCREASMASGEVSSFARNASRVALTIHGEGTK
ncbi:MAG: hypothetical protein OEV42_03880 [Deltaproteobacteria bacterium]|nr:hypothetical protein [Deltaproteobacteria bacterium]